MASAKVLSGALCALAFSLPMPGCGGDAQKPPKAPTTVTVPPPPPPRARVAPKETAPSSPPDPEAACAELAGETRKKLAELVQQGVDAEQFDVEKLATCTPFDGGAATLALTRGEPTDLPGIEVPCVGANVELHVFGPGDAMSMQPLFNGVTCSYDADLRVVDWEKNGHGALVVEQSGLELIDPVFKRLIRFDRALVLEWREGALAPPRMLEPLLQELEELGQPKYAPTQSTAVVTGVLSADVPALAYDILRVRLIDCGLRTWLDCTSTPGLRVMSLPARKDGALRFPLLSEMDRDARKAALFGCDMLPEPRGGEAAARDVLEAFCAAALSPNPKPPPASTWAKWRRKHCEDPKECFYFDEVEHAFGRWLEALRGKP